jgi:hypothetical protein
MPKITRTFTVAELEAIGIPDEWHAAKGQAAERLHEEQIDTRRWVSVHELVFRLPGETQAWSVTYEKGLTEEQEPDPFWGDTVTATAMEERQVTVTRWEPVETAST